MTTSVWDAAGRLAALGLAVLPLKRGGKVPCLARGVLAASSDPDQVARWARMYPTGNVGIAAGGPRRLLVIDLDVSPAEGAAAREALERMRARLEELAGGPLPRTWTVATARAGVHLYFTLPAGCGELGNSARKLGAGIDSRSTRGYCVAPPSILADGRRWRWMRGRSPWDLPLAALPAALARALAPTPLPEARTPHPEVRAGRTHSPGPLPLGALPPGPALERRVARYLAALPPLRDGEGRNSRGFHLACTALHAWGLAPADAAAVLGAWNARLTDPLPAARLAALLTNAQRYGGRRGAA